MHFQTDPDWLHHLLMTQVVRRSGDVSDFYRRAREGHYIRLAEGVFLPTALWRALPDDEQFRARIHAVALASRPGLVFSHLSAAALWRLPIVGCWPDRPEALVGTDASGPTRRAFTARQFAIPDRLDDIDGIAVTSLARTLVDVARTRPLGVSVAMLDHALRRKDGYGVAGARATRDDLMREMVARSSPRGSRRCRDAVEFADGRSASAGESISRTGMHLLGLPAPQLQHEFRDRFGLMVVDFWWPELNLIGEFDGYGKYLREQVRPGESVADAVMAEKRREDRLRALGPRMTRWDWPTAISLPCRRDAPQVARCAQIGAHLANLRAERRSNREASVGDREQQVAG